MAEYYLKADNIMKNMFVAALKDEIQAPGKCLPKSGPMI